MKIVFLGKFNQNQILTGPEKYTVNLLNFISKSFESVFIEYYFKSYKRSNFLTRIFGKEIISSSPEILRLGNLRLFLYLLKHQPEIIHVLTSERFTIPVYLYKIFLKSKVVTTFHSVLRYEIPYDSIRRKKIDKYKDFIWETFAVKFSDKLIFLSEAQLELAKRFYNLNNHKNYIIPNGVEIEFYNPNKIFNIKESINIVFYNGINDNIERGLDEIVSMLNLLNSNKIKFYIIGGIKKIIDAKFNYEFVSPMNKSELIDFLKDKHVILKSIFYDSFSIFALECMTAGLILIVSQKVGISSFINNCENGFIYDSNNLSELRTIIEKIINEKYNLQQISENARKIVNKLSWDKVAKKYFDLYHKMNEN